MRIIDQGIQNKVLELSLGTDGKFANKNDKLFHESL